MAAATTYQDPLIYLARSDRLVLKSIRIWSTDSRSGATTIALRRSAKDFRYLTQRDDGALVEYVQDPDAQGAPAFLLKVEREAELKVHFSFIVRQGPVEGLTFVHGATAAEVDRVITSGYAADSNIHRHSNVVLLGDHAAGEAGTETEFGYTWTWQPPPDAPAAPQLRGWKTVCNFAEFHKAENRFATLARFSLWVQDDTRDDVLSQASVAPLLRPGQLHISSFSSYDGQIQPPLRPESPEIMTPVNLESAPYFPEYAPSMIQPPAATARSGGAAPVSVPPLATPVLQSAFSPIMSPPAAPSIIDSSASTLAATTSIDQMEDGPVFRATLAGLESKTEAFRLRIKKLMKRANSVRSFFGQYVDAYDRLFEAMALMADAHPAACRPVWEAYLESASAQMQQLRHHEDAILHTAIIAPLRRIYDFDIKVAEGKKREFEEESKDFYGFVSRYLSKRNDADEKKLMEKDSKYNAKKRNFELKRFDYHCYMQDLHGGRKEQEVLRQLTLYAMSQSSKILAAANTIRELRPGLEALSTRLEDAGKDFRLIKSDREERRRHIEKSNTGHRDQEGTPVHPTMSRSGSRDAIHMLTLGGAGAVGGNADDTSVSALRTPLSPQLGQQSIDAVAALRPPGVLALAHEDAPRRKEGILWALSRPGTHDPKVASGVQKLNWHKFWVVLAGGQISEYRDWKEAVDHTGDPIDLRMATVRPARNTDRRFCFEVLTPNMKRVYQTTGDEEVESWIKHITAAIEGILDGSASQVSLDGERIQHNREVKQMGGNAEAFFGSRLTRRSTLSSALQPGATRTQASQQPPLPGQQIRIDEDARRILTLVRDSAAENARCADCGGPSKVEWVSINLCTILCIECSGVHRSLGSHISKVRSLLLDTNSFTPDLIDLLRGTGNKVANSIYEANLDRFPAGEKPNDKSSREARVRFIQAKYVDRAFVEYPAMSPNDVLLESVASTNLAATYGAIASRADINAVDDGRTGLPAVLLALLSSVELPPVQEDEAGTSGAGDDAAEEAVSYASTFPIAELLFLNGADVPSQAVIDRLAAADAPGAGTRLSTAARSYLAAKVIKSISSSSPPTGITYLTPASAAGLGQGSSLGNSLASSTNSVSGAAASAIGGGGGGGPRSPPGALQRSVSSGAAAGGSNTSSPSAVGGGGGGTNSIVNGAHKLQKRISSGSRILKSPPSLSGK